MKQIFEIDCDGGRISAEFLREYLQEQFKLIPQSPTRRKRDFNIKVREITDRPVTVTIEKPPLGLKSK